jgi:hypothetical protein
MISSPRAFPEAAIALAARTPAIKPRMQKVIVQPRRRTTLRIEGHGDWGGEFIMSRSELSDRYEAL